MIGGLFLAAPVTNAAEDWGTGDDGMRKDVTTIKQKMEDLEDRLSAMEGLLAQLVEGQKAMAQQITTEHGRTRKWILNG